MGADGRRSNLAWQPFLSSAVSFVMWPFWGFPPPQHPKTGVGGVDFESPPMPAEQKGGRWTPFNSVLKKTKKYSEESWSRLYIDHRSGVELYYYHYYLMVHGTVENSRNNGNWHHTPRNANERNYTVTRRTEHAAGISIDFTHTHCNHIVNTFHSISKKTIYNKSHKYKKIISFPPNIPR